MSNKITIELCAEDRARLDRLAEALEKRACDTCVTSATETTKEEVKDSVADEEETTAAEDVTKSEPEKAVDRAVLRAKVIELSAKGLKEQTRDIVRAYAQTVTSVPDDKVAECYEKLLKLEAK